MIQRLPIRALMTVIGMISTVVAAIAAVAMVTTAVAISAARRSVVMAGCKIARTTAPVTRTRLSATTATAQRLIYVTVVMVRRATLRIRSEGASTRRNLALMVISM